MFKNKLRNGLNLILTAVILMLAACSTTKKDGPPSFFVDESKVADAVPKAEPHSKYGNLKSYRVFGKTYHVLPSSQDYEEQGIASWYGKKFHAQRTSNGERYNMLSMTAAHKTLPLPTYVQVTNLRNGRKVIVRVNDRGPFEGNRLIDLSYVAAKKLGMLGHGTTFVDVKAIDPMHFDKNTFDHVTHTNNFYLANNSVILPKHSVKHFASNKHAHAHAHSSGIYLQVGAYKSRVLAEHMRKRMSGIVTSPVRITHLAKKHLYRVQIGPIKDVATARHITQKLKSVGLNTRQTLEA